MAAPGGKFFIQNKLGNKAPHHESFQKLWETKWKMGDLGWSVGEGKGTQEFQGWVSQVEEVTCS